MIELASPGFLWALPAVLLPILIHLLFRRRHRPVQWAAMQHLLRAERAVRRSIRWRHILLLLLRAGAVLLAVLLFCRPGLARPLPGEPEGGEVFVLLDDSASMGQRLKGGSPFQTAGRFLEELAGRVSRRAGRLTLFVAGRPEAVLGDDPPPGPSELRERVEELGTSAAGLRPGESLPRLGRAAGEQGAAEPEFYVVTDLRSEDWGSERLNPRAAAALRDLQSYGPVRVVDVGAEPGPNFAVEEVLTAGRFLYAGAPLTLNARLVNRSAGRLPPGRLDVRLAGRRLSPVRHPGVPPGERREALLEVSVPDAGTHALEVSLRGEDSLAADDRRLFSFEAEQEVPVLILEGRPGAGAYLRAALRPGGDGPGLRPEVRTTAQGVPDSLEDYAAVFLCDVPSPTLWADRLDAYVRNGGRLVAFLGRGVRQRAWEATLLNEEDGLLPARITGRVRRPPERPARLGRLDFSHPLLAPFSGWEALFKAAEFREFWRIEPLRDARVLGSCEADPPAPAMLARVTGEGRMVLFAAPADDLWNDWPRSETARVSYLALMLWLVEQGEAGADALNLQGGEGLRHTVEAGYRSEARLRLPGGEEEATLRGRPLEDGRLVFETGPIRRAGVGRLTLLTSEEQTRVVFFVVNLPRGEGRLARTDAELLERADVEGRLRVVPYGDDRAARAPAPGRRDLWPAIAAFLAGVLFVESLLASRFGRPTEEGGAA